MIKQSNALIGSAGVHYVCAILSMNGMIALPTVRNTKGIDIVVLNHEGSFLANLQIKTSHKKVSSWIVGADYERWYGDNNHYVFVRYYYEKFEAFLESSENVIQQVKQTIELDRRRGVKDWVPRWHLPRKELPTQKLQWRLFSRFKQLKIKKTR
ncbi:MAG: hypothetical protein ACHP65_09255 [Legionellales bacterium]